MKLRLFRSSLLAAGAVALLAADNAAALTIPGEVIYREPFTHGRFVTGTPDSDVSISTYGWTAEWGPGAAASGVDVGGAGAGTLAEAVSSGTGIRAADEGNSSTLEFAATLHTQVNAGMPTDERPDGTRNGFAFFRNQTDPDDLVTEPSPAFGMIWTDEAAFEFSGVPESGEGQGLGPTAIEFWINPSSTQVTYNPAVRVDGEWYINTQTTSVARTSDWLNVLIPIHSPLIPDRQRHWVTGAYIEGQMLAGDLSSLSTAALPLGTVDAFGLYITTPDHGVRARFDGYTIYGFGSNVVPEPTAGALACLALVALAGDRRVG
ncbi:hypothetical protein [Botrimarina sp.]|uniref:hypothetical protein n=1 Tax=Botrimarina sp. TaxID=2795802 RepID=UPI0032ECFC13